MGEWFVWHTFPGCCESGNPDPAIGKISRKKMYTISIRKRVACMGLQTLSRGDFAAMMHDNILNRKFDLTTTRQWALNDTRLNE
jgi:hypothetical protein